MTIDTVPITDGVTQFVQLAVGYIPLGVTIVVVPVAIALGLRLADWIAKTMKNSFGF